MSSTASSIQDTLNHINNTLKASNQGPYANYSCKNVSWDDVQRGTVGGSLSCWGANITDTRLFAKDGRQLFTVRGNNWNERLGKVSSSDIALVASAPGENGNGDRDVSTSERSSRDTMATTTTTNLRPFTLREILSRSSEFGAYAGLTVDSLADETLDKEVSVRFQTTFLPVEDEGQNKSKSKSALEFAPEAYNYNTHSDDDPRNLILLCTSQGLAIQQDGSGSKKLYHHAVDTGEAGSVVKRYWLEAESSNHKVGGSQVESKEEKEDAIQRGKATSSVIGVKGIGTRFNVLMTIQVPLQQQKVVTPEIVDCFFGGYDCESEEEDWEEEECREECAFDCFGGDDEDGDADGDDYDLIDMAVGSDCKGSGMKMKRTMKPMMKKFGKSSAARVSRGSEVDTWDGLTVKQPKRHENEHITATIVMYYTCSGGVPTEQDVKAAIDDLEELYRSVETNGTLSEDKFNFMKSELTVKNMMDIEKKLVTQPPPPKPPAPLYFDVFPSDG